MFHAAMCRGRIPWLVLTVGAVACGGAAQVEEARAEVDPKAKGLQLLADAAARARAANRSLVVVAHAEWCEPCNELQHRVLDAAGPGGDEPGHELLLLDFDDPVQGAACAQLRVLGLPTTVVLVPTAGPVQGGLPLVEVARIEGFETAEEYRTALAAGVQRSTAPGPACDAGAGNPQFLDKSLGVELLLPRVVCTAEGLRGADATAMAARLELLLQDVEFRIAAQGWTEPERARLAGAFRLLGRYASRVTREPSRCTGVFQTLADWPGLPEKSKPGAVFWQAKCLVHEGEPEAALRVLEAHVAAEKSSPDAQEIAAELLVREKRYPERASQLLQNLVSADPTRHWAWYLRGELALHLGDAAAARRHWTEADRLSPGKPLYIRHLAKLR